VAEPLEQVVLKAMDKNRNVRYQTATEMEQALKDALKEIESSSPTTSLPTPKTQDMIRPTPVKSGSMMGPVAIIGGVTAVLLCVVLAVVIAFFSFSGDRESGTAVSGEVEVANDLFQATDEPVPTSEPTATPIPPTPSGSGPETDIVLSPVELDREILFSETFDSNENNWMIDEQDDEYGQYSSNIVDGRYRLSHTAAQGVFAWEHLPEAEFDNFVMVVDAIPVEANTDFYGYGLTFRGNADNDGLYVFKIEDDSYLVNLLADGEWYTLVDYTPMPAINVGGPNQLMIEAIGPMLTFYINGEEATSIEDDSLQTGSVGMALELNKVGDSVTVEFDNLMVYALSDEELAGISNVLFEEYFDSDINGWATGEFEDEYSQNEITIEDGTYTLGVTAKKPTYIEKVLPNQKFSDFVLTLETTPHDIAEHYAYGVAFRENPDADTYTFEIRNDGLYVVFVYDGEWRKLKDWSGAKAIKPGETNELKVIANGESLTFFVNGEELTTIKDDTLAEGQIGLIVDMFEEGPAAVDFDNLVVRRVK
jgi:hypothetical protein